MMETILSRIELEKSPKWRFFNQDWPEAVRPTIIWPYAGVEYCFNGLSNIDKMGLSVIKFADCENSRRRSFQAVFEGDKIVVTHKNCVVPRKSGCKVKKCLTLVENTAQTEITKKHTKVSDDEIFSGAADFKTFDTLSFLKTGFKRSNQLNQRKLLTMVSVPFEIELPEHKQIDTEASETQILAPRVVRSASAAASSSDESSQVDNIKSPQNVLVPTVQVCDEENNRLQNFRYLQGTGQLQLVSYPNLCLGIQNVQRKSY